MRAGLVLLLSFAARAALAAPPSLTMPAELAQAGMGVGLAGAQHNARVAYGGTNYLMVWEDDRSGGNSDLYAARVSSSGVLIDTQPLPICRVVGEQRAIRVVFDGTNYIVAWLDERAPRTDVYATRVTLSGQVLDPDGVNVTAGEPFQAYGMELVSTGAGVVMVWSEYSLATGNPNIVGAALSAQLVLGAPFTVSSLNFPEYMPRIAFNGTNLLVAFEVDTSAKHSDLRAVRVTPSGTVLDATPLTLTTLPDSEDYLRVASDGQNFLVLWTDQRNGNNDIWMTVVTGAGVVQSPDGAAFATLPLDETAPDVSFDGTDYLVAFDDSNAAGGPFTKRVSSTGAILDPSSVAVVSNGGALPTIACDGTALCMTAAEFGRWDYRDVELARVSTANVPQDAAPFAGLVGPTAQWQPEVAWDGQNFTAVWVQDNGLEEVDVYAARIAPTGQSLDVDGIPVDVHTGFQGYPAIDFAFGEYLIAYIDDSGSTTVQFRRMRPDGTFLDAAPVPIGTGETGNVRVTHDRNNFFVVYQDWTTATGNDVRGARISPSGTVLDPDGFAIAAVAGSQEYAQVTSNGTEFLAAWLDYDVLGLTVRGARIDGSGKVLDPDGGFTLTLGGEAGDDPQLASDGQNFLVAYRGDNGLLSAHRVTASGTVLDNPAIAVNDTGSDFVALTHDGRNYWAVWVDTRFPNRVLFGTAITSAGRVPHFDGGADPYSDLTLENVDPSLAASGPGRFALVYGEGDLDAGVSRARTRIATVQAPNGGWCHTTADCESGFCVDGVCCDSACGGGAPNDCQACAEDAGAALDGTCGAALAGFTCRPSSDSCDIPETCDGLSLSCPPDLHVPDGGACTFGSDGGVAARKLTVGCGCSSVPGLLPLLALALMLRRRARPR